MLHVDSLRLLISAVEKYETELRRNYAVMVNAANVCDQAMGSDTISQKYIGQLNEALKELEKTRQLAENVKKELQKDLQKALSVI